MTDTPYINKQNWGRELINRLGNSLDSSGSINAWDELPINGQDGKPLSDSHTGYMGILKTNEPEIIKWNGSAWETVLKIPFSLEGEPIDTYSIKASNVYVEFLDPGLNNDIAFIVESDNTSNNLVLSAYRKSNGIRLWTSTGSLRPGYLFFGYTYNLASFNSFCVDENNIYFGGIELQNKDNTTTGYLSIFAFRLSDGAFLWRKEIGSVISPNYSVLSIVVSNGFLYLSQRYTNSILKLNALTGIIEATYNYTQYVTTDQGGLFCDEINQKLIFWVRSITGNPCVYVFPLGLNSTVFEYNFNAQGSYPFLYNSQFLKQDSSQKNLFYFFQAKDDLFIVWKYNALTNVPDIWGQFSKENIFFDYIVGIQSTPSQIILYGVNNSSVNKSILNNDENTVFVETLFPGGQGIMDYVAGLNVSSVSDIYFAKIISSQSGFGEELVNSLEIFLSLNSQRIVTLNNSILVNSTNKSLIKSNANFDNFYSQKITADKIDLTKLIVRGSTPATSSLPAEHPDAGITIGFNLCAFAYNSIGAFSGESKGYSGGGTYISGTSWGCQPVKGRIIQTRSSSLYAGICLFDQSIGKFFLQVAPPQALNTVIPSFPDGSGITINENNYLGVGTQNPSYKLSVIGTISGTTVRNSGGEITSDPRLKLNMTSLPGSELWDVCQSLNPITFVYKPDFQVEIQEISKDEDGNDVINTTKTKWPLPQGIQYGYNALEVAELFPELVDEDPQGIKYLNSGALFPIFQSATVAKINSLESKIESLESMIASLITRIEVLENA